MPDPDALMNEVVEGFVGLMKVSKNINMLMWKFNIPPRNLLDEIGKRFERRCKEEGFIEHQIDHFMAAFRKQVETMASGPPDG